VLPHRSLLGRFIADFVAPAARLIARGSRRDYDPTVVGWIPSASTREIIEETPIRCRSACPWRIVVTAGRFREKFRDRFGQSPS
jgi:hypothetical protein